MKVYFLKMICGVMIVSPIEIIDENTLASGKKILYPKSGKAIREDWLDVSDFGHTESIVGWASEKGLEETKANMVEAYMKNLLDLIGIHQNHLTRVGKRLSMEMTFEEACNHPTYTEKFKKFLRKNS